jgi:hypothetical protein
MKTGSLPCHGAGGNTDAPPLAFARDGYRSANRQGKPDFTIAHKPLCCRHFLDSGNLPPVLRLHAIHRDI